VTSPDAERESADLALYVSRNVARLTERRAAGGWGICWPGLLFPQAWFLYRKMYVWAALVTAGPLALAYVPGVAYVDWFATALGAMGLKIYVYEARRAIRRIRAEAADEAQARARIARAGGVSALGAALGAVYIFSAFVLSLKSVAPAVLLLR
jgi:hypothetical protein